MNKKISLTLSAAGLFFFNGCVGVNPQPEHSEEGKAPPQVVSLVADKSSPQAAGTVPITWTAYAPDGEGKKVYVFEHVGQDGIVQVVQRGFSPTWSWMPEKEGRFRVRVKLNDPQGQQSQSRWSEPFTIAPALVIESFGTGRKQSQSLIGMPVKWSVISTGGVGEKKIHLYLDKGGGAPILIQESPSNEWTWKPEELGNYRVRAVVTDALGNKVESEWSQSQKIVTPLTIEGISADLPSPQQALHKEIRWAARVLGGVGKTTYEFQTDKNNIVVTEQVGKDPIWKWNPAKAGKYRVRVIARDEDGNKSASEWTPEYLILPAVKKDTVIALLPVENLSGVKSPTEEIESVFSEHLRDAGFRLLDKSELEKFMRKYRMRHTGGVGSKLGQLMKNETGAEAVLITSIESYQDENPPKISLIARIVLCGTQSKIAWMKSVGLTGIDSPGLLGLGLVKEAPPLIEKGIQEIIASLNQYLAGEEDTLRLLYRSQRTRGKPISRYIFPPGKYLPRQYYRATEFEPSARYSVAVVPLLNKHARKNAGNILALHFVEKLHSYENLEVLEPGEVREQLLQYRLIMPEGTSLALSDALASQKTIDADLVLSGRVFNYQDLKGPVKADFSTQVYDGKKREIIWWSRSYATGDEGVYFFDIGRTHAAHELTSLMAGAISAILFKGKVP